MSLGAGIVKRCTAIREVPHRLPFLQTVGADIRVGHSDASKPPPDTTPAPGSQSGIEQPPELGECIRLVE
eukprot:3113059-Rhodomonas_salina.1